MRRKQSIVLSPADRRLLPLAILGLLLAAVIADVRWALDYHSLVGRNIYSHRDCMLLGKVTGFGQHIDSDVIYEAAYLERSPQAIRLNRPRYVDLEEVGRLGPIPTGRYRGKYFFWRQYYTYPRFTSMLLWVAMFANLVWGGSTFIKRIGLKK